MDRLIKRGLTSFAVFACALAANPANAVGVSFEVGLVIDISGSVDASEYELQRQGYADAFNDAGVQSLIEQTPNGVAVALFYFSTTSTANKVGGDVADTDFVMWQAPILDWTLLENSSDASAFATAIGAIGRPVVDPDDPEGDTNIANGINAAANSMNNNDFEGLRRVIDVSTDGLQNVELDGSEGACGTSFTSPIEQVCFDVVEGQRDAAGLQGIIINGIAIETEPTFGLGTLSGYLEDHVITGEGSFALAVEDFDTFGDAITDKIAAELSVPIIPIPAAAYLFGSALLGLASLARRRQHSTA